MPERKSTPIEMVVATTDEIQGGIERIAREGAKKLLQAALEAEVEEHLSRYEQITDAEGHRLVVRNGHAPRRLILTGVGPVAVRRPRIDEREVKGQQGHQGFASSILPRFLRRSPTLEGHWRHSTSKGSAPTISAPLWRRSWAKGRPGCLPPRSVSSSKVWEAEYEAWRKRPLESKEYAYLWADGVYFNVRLEEQTHLHPGGDWGQLSREKGIVGRWRWLS